MTVNHQFAEKLLLSIVRPDAMPADVHRVVTEAIRGGFAGVVVTPAYVARVATLLRSENSPIELASVVGFPHGTGKSTLKAIEATSTIKDGATAIHVVPFLPNLVRGDVDAAKAELIEIVRAARATRRDAIINVVIESALLMRRGGAGKGEALVAAACRTARESGCDGVVTNSGLQEAGGASVQAIQIVRQAGEGLTIVAAGGIRDVESAAMLLGSGGADRVVVDAD